MHKIIAQAGLASRRAAEAMILKGRVSLNGAVVTRLGTKADAVKDEIRIDGKLISADHYLVYVVLHKPRGYVTTLNDPQGRPIVTDLLNDIQERVYPVGRLDYDSEGLLLLTNDGDFAYRMQHPRFEISKTYLVKVKGKLADKELEHIRAGAELGDGRFVPSAVKLEKLNMKNSWVNMTIHEGRNRIIRRFFEALDHPVMRLVRVAIGNLKLGNLRPGEYKVLERQDIAKYLPV